MSGERAAAIYSLIETAKMLGLDPEAYLPHVFERSSAIPSSRIRRAGRSWGESAPAPSGAGGLIRGVNETSVVPIWPNTPGTLACSASPRHFRTMPSC
jgi:hypothetical protein